MFAINNEKFSDPIIEKTDFTYREKLLAFMDGLGLNNIWEAGKLTKEELYLLGVQIKSLQKEV